MNSSVDARVIAASRLSDEDQKYIISSSFIDVGEGQHLFVVEWGNKLGTPFLLLHGGPGDSFRPSHVALFNPETDHVIFFDQRGCGASTPNAGEQTKEEIEASNTPAHIVADMEVLRTHFGFEKVHLVGGSWGSTLALLYAIAHPEKTASLHLWGIYLATREQTLSIFSDKTSLPDLPSVCARMWNTFLGLVPETSRRFLSDGSIDPSSVLEHYAGKQGTNHSDQDIARKHAETYLIYEYTLCQPDGMDADPEGVFTKIKEDITSDANSLPAARIEMTYDVNGTFIEENFILNNIATIQHIPIYIVQGIRDWCTPMRFAKKLEEHLGKPCVEVVAAGHLRTDKALKEGLQKNIAHMSSLAN